MVGLFKTLLPALLFATFAAAQSPPNAFNITQPSSTIWWVGQSINVMAWDCQSPEAIAFNNFTILISNVNANVFTGELAFIAIQANDQCSVNISPDQVNQNPGPGYILSFANIINETEVYASSQQFEIKPLGSLYPSQVTSSVSGVSGTGTATSSASSSSSSSGATLGSNSPSFLEIAGILGLLAAGLLGA